MEIIIAFIILVIVFLVFWYVAKQRDEKNSEVSFDDPTLQFHALTTAASVVDEVKPVVDEVKPVEAAPVAPVAPVVEEVKPAVQKTAVKKPAVQKTAVKKPAAVRASAKKPLAKAVSKQPAKSTKSESLVAASKKAKDASKTKVRKLK